MNDKHTSAGFTLVEMIVAVGIFSMVVVVATGAVFAVVNTNQKVRAIKSVVENLNFAVESMSRVLRFSTNYHCGSLGTLSSPNDCAYPNGSNFIAFTDYRDGIVKSYRLNGTTIEVYDPATSIYIPITGSEVTVTNLTFYVENSAGTNGQPRIKMVIQGYAGATQSARSVFNLQTMVSERPH